MIDPRGNYVGTADCGMHHPVQKPPPPYGNQEDPTNTLFFEDGFKEVRGYLTEGRYLVLEKAGAALTNKLKSSSLTTSRASELHNFKAQRWILHYHGGEESGLFLISSALDGRWLGTRGRMHISDNKADAEPMRIKFRGNGKGYYVQYAKTGEYIDVNHVGKLEIRDSWNVPPRGYTIFSVSYHD
jgi:phospholipase C